MDPRVRIRIADFVAKESARAERFELRQLAAGGEQSVRSWDVGEDDDAPHDPIAERIAEEAIADADAQTGPARYALVVYARGRGTHYAGRILFRLAGSATSDAIEPSEAPTATGLVAQSQRHLEAMARTYTLSTDANVRGLAEENERLREHVRRLETQAFAQLAAHVDAVKTLESLLSEKAARDLAAQRAAKEDEQKAHVVSQIVRYLPAIADRVLGPKALPAAATNGTNGAAKGHANGAPRASSAPPGVDAAEAIAIANGVRAFMHSLTYAQIEQICAVLDASQTAALVALVEKAAPEGPPPAEWEPANVNGAPPAKGADPS